MTVSALNPASETPVVTASHMLCILGCSGATLNRYIIAGRVPHPDARGFGAGKLWRLSTIRAWRPDLVADFAALASRAPAKLILPTAA
ncbi:MAG: hypothetical protein LAE24_00185 [Candidatus Contendobacter sp.]|nr:hypothetical protein [Candidatus Contendobacter sp.]